MKSYFKIIFLRLVVLVFFGAFLFTASSTKEGVVKYLPPLTDLQRYNLKGKVKKLIQSKSITEFNESGFDIKQTKKIYNSDNIITEIIIAGNKKVFYTVNSRNLLEKETFGNRIRNIITYNKDFTEGR